MQAGSPSTGGCQSVINVLILRCSTLFSTLRAVVLTEHVKALLRKQGTVFGDFIVTEFEDPILKDHAVSVSVSDIPKNLPVRLQWNEHTLHHSRNHENMSSVDRWRNGGGGHYSDIELPYSCHYSSGCALQPPSCLHASSMPAWSPIGCPRK